MTLRRWFGDCIDEANDNRSPSPGASYLRAAAWEDDTGTIGVASMINPTLSPKDVAEAQVMSVIRELNRQTQNRGHRQDDGTVIFYVENPRIDVRTLTAAAQLGKEPMPVNQIARRISVKMAWYLGRHLIRRNWERLLADNDQQPRSSPGASYLRCDWCGEEHRRWFVQRVCTNCVVAPRWALSRRRLELTLWSVGCAACGVIGLLAGWVTK